MEQQFFDQFFRSAPPDIDVGAIRQEWLALKPPYQINDRRLPLPVWARRGFTEDGEQAWAILGRDVGRIDLARPFCIYIHIPFCASKCSFCDCYSFKLGQHQARHVEAYIALLNQEMRLWSHLGTLAHRPVSTVHLGGGTPTFLGEDSFSRLMHSCCEQFCTEPQTEWALESTTSELTDSMFALLDSLSFTRLHIGVQSLEDNVRWLINRREPAVIVLEKISRAVAMGWVVSVDLIYGLPEQSLEGLLNDIQSLVAVGVDGFSLYELQLSSHNRQFAQRHGLVDRERPANYLLLRAASRRLDSLGYKKIAFNHFARERDLDLYFTFPQRREDCLALGTIADGVFGDYHYRHPEYKFYCQSVNETFPGLQGGLRRNTLENRLHPLEVDLMSASLHPDLFADLLGKDYTAELFHRWRESALVEDDPGGGCLRLTANGSWFISKMMAQLSDNPAVYP